jgi:ATP-dependent exoDNAse (exonuclease V) beta subunit
MIELLCSGIGHRFKARVSKARKISPQKSRKIISQITASPVRLQKAEKLQRENDERFRIATEEGRICFDLFASSVGKLLHGRQRLRELQATIYPLIILDEFQDTDASQWRVVEALGVKSTLIAVADPEQWIWELNCVMRFL